MASFPHRMVAVLARTVVALVQDPLALLADVVFWAALTLTFWSLWRLIVRVERWIGRHVADRALDREYADLCDTYSAGEPDETQVLPGVTRIGPAAPPPPPHRPSRRHRVPSLRIPRRSVRHTTSSSDRSTR